MPEQNDLEKVALVAEKFLNPDGSLLPILNEDKTGLTTSLASLLSLPEFREENNPDLPFSISARYRGNTWGDAIQTIGMENLRYHRESEFLAQWMGRLTGKSTVHCFENCLTTEYENQDEGVLQLQILRDKGMNCLSIGDDGLSSKGKTFEIWEKGVLLRRTGTSLRDTRISVSIPDGTAVVVRCGTSPCGVEILLAEGEFGPDEWKALLACLCLQGRFNRALEIIRDHRDDFASSSSLLLRFQAFLTGTAAFTKSEGYVLRPLPVVRSSHNPSQEDLALWESVPEDYQVTWQSGWNYLAQRDFPSATKSFLYLRELGLKEWGIPLEVRLVRHLESLSSSKSPLKSEVELNARFWKDIFEDVFSLSSH